MSMNILIVEDSALIRARLLDLFAGVSGNKIIRTVATLSLGLECVKSAWPKLVILDIHLPDGNSIGSISQMKKMLPGLDVMVLSNDASAFNRHKCQQAGAKLFFDKSTEFETLLEVVQRQLVSN